MEYLNAEILSEIGFSGLGLDVAVKGLMVMLLAGVVVLLMRRGSAAKRHLVWMVGMVSLICLPILSVLGPEWQVPVWPADEVNPVQVINNEAPELTRLSMGEYEQGRIRLFDFEATAAVEERVSGEVGVLGEVVVPVESEIAPSQQAAPDTVALDRAEPVTASIHWSLWVMLLWAGGVVSVIIPVLIGLFRLVRLTRGCEEVVDGTVVEVLKELAWEVGVRRPVALRRGTSQYRVSMPMAWGWRRPVILLPGEAGAWPREQLQVVLLHELAHIRRWDWLMQLAARVVSGVYWFNPMVWVAKRQLRIEREKACDDVVLRYGFGAAEYAEQLLAIVRQLNVNRGVDKAAVAMARPGHIEARLRAILDGGRSRAGLTRYSVVISLLVIVMMVLPLAAMQPVNKVVDISPEILKGSVTEAQPGDQQQVVGEAVIEGQPKVVWVSPADGAEGVEPLTEIRIRFDRPMNPNMAGLQRGMMEEQKGKFKYLDMAYDEENYEFVIQVELEVNGEYNLVVNEMMFDILIRRGFCDREASYAEEFKWGFRTQTAAVAAGGPAPKVVSVSQGEGATLPVLSWVEVTFDQPMDPDSFDVVNYSSQNARQYMRRHVEYDAEYYRFKLPVMLIPNWNNTITFKRFLSAGGVEAEEVTLHYKGAEEEDPDGWWARMEEEEGSRVGELKSVLGEVKRRRMELRSLSMLVVIVRGGDGVSSSSGIFKMQGDQFYGDASLLVTRPMVLGGDGEEFWGYNSKYIYRAPYEEMESMRVVICDPFGLTKREVVEAIKEMKLEYLGMRDFKGRVCHVIQSWQVEVGGDYVTGKGLTWWVDAVSYLPVKVESDGGTKRYIYNEINKVYSAEDFQPTFAESVELEVMEPSYGFYRRYLRLADGSSDGSIYFSWGWMNDTGGTYGTGVSIH